MIKDLAHITLGALAALSTLTSPILSALITVLFIVYELDEGWHLHDQAYQDIAEYTAGFSIATLILLAQTMNLLPPFSC